MYPAIRLATRQLLETRHPALEAAYAAHTFTDIMNCIGRRGWSTTPARGVHVLPCLMRTQVLQALVSRIEQGLDAESNVDIGKCVDIFAYMKAVNVAIGKPADRKSAPSGIHTLPAPWPMRMLRALRGRIPAMAHAYGSDALREPSNAQAIQDATLHLTLMVQRQVTLLRDSARNRILAHLAHHERALADDIRTVDLRLQQLMDKRLARACQAPGADWRAQRSLYGPLDGRQRVALLRALFHRHVHHNGPLPPLEELQGIFSVSEREYQDTWTEIDADHALHGALSIPAMIVLHRPQGPLIGLLPGPGTMPARQ